MRHRVKGRKLGRTKAHREATLRALGSALIKEHRIQTTLPKAKELRTFIEPLITVAKVDNAHNRRKAFSYLQDKVAVTELFNEVGPAAADRPGGYTRVVKMGHRLGDAADMAVIELVDFNDVQPESKVTKKKRTRRGGRSGSSVAEDVQAEKKVEEVEESVDEVEETVDEVEETVDSENEEVVSEETSDSSEATDAPEKTESSDEKENSEK